MKIFGRKFERIRNIPGIEIEKDFCYNVFSYFILGLFLAGGIILQIAIREEIMPMHLAGIAIGTIAAGGILTLLPLWSVVIQLIVLAWIVMYAFLGGYFAPLFALITPGLLLSPALQLIYQWDKVVILRVGKFKSVCGPGLFFLIPIIDRVADFVDTRIRATDFSAEKTITKDTVPVHVDALCFWMIWDAKRAILEVENFVEAVILSAQTALRDSIGKHDLSVLLSDRDILCQEIQKILDAKTNPWGITILSVEFTDIIIPQNLEDAMSKRAQAEREKQSRVILGTAEVEIAKKFAEASESYKDNPTALHLRAMNMVYEGIRQRGSMVLLPSSALDTMNLGTVIGAVALQKMQASAGEDSIVEPCEKSKEEKDNDNPS